ncbi:MAG: hypothetical protein DBX59_08550 [Bacillota bacterium]|nr:MAG: hypothetical protein DBX59_08550 [Bacillota bacterium]
MRFSKKFIQRTATYNTFDCHVPAPYLRKKFALAEKPAQAEITICGLGFYRLWLNGKEITKGMLASYISNPDDVLYYDLYAVSDLLQQGENIIAVLLGNGFLNDPAGDVWDFDKAAFRDAPKMALAVEVDGATLFEADESFKTSPSPIVFDDYRAGEHYDATKEIFGWNTLAFDDSAWDNAIIAKTPAGTPRVPVCPPIRAIREICPSAFEKRGDGWLYAFPENNAGVCRLEIDGKEGQKIKLTFSELATKDGVNIKNIINGNYPDHGYLHRDFYTCKAGKQSYTPSFTYHGFQYVFVEGIEDGQATENLLTYIVVHTDLKSAGSFACSNEIVNKLQENTRRSDLANFYDFPTDCPHREKNGWTGDAALSAEQFMLNFHAEKSFREWLYNVRASQIESGALSGIVPTAGWGFAWGNGPAWDTVVTQLSYYGYKYTADKTILTENFDCIVAYLRYAKTRLNENGLLAYGLGDWCPAGGYNNDVFTSLEITDTLTIIDTCYKAGVIAEILGKTEEKAEFDAFYALLRKNFREKFVENGEIKREFATQSAVSMALYYKAFEKEETERAVGQLLALIAAKNDYFDVGVLGARTLFRVLSDYGYDELALKLIVQKGFPSYRYHLDRGATTLWENFIDLADGEIKPKAEGREVDSLNHHFWGDISAWFYKYIAGIRINPALKDPFTVEIAPHFIEGITHCRAEREYLGGKITVEWERKPDGVHVEVSAPAQVKIVKKW